MSDLLAYLDGRRADMVADLRRFTEQETPSTDKARLDRFAHFLAAYGEELTGGRAVLIEPAGAGAHVRIEAGAGAAPGLLLLGHFDTVWPAGTLERMPFRVEAGVARGPGVFDMKGGAVQGFWALRALRELRGRLPPLVFLLNSDEELGSPTSRELIEAEARRAAAVLVLEPSLDGALKTARKGVGLFHLEVAGRAAHAGVDPFGGVSAIEELSRLVLGLHSLSDARTGTTVNVGVAAGGTRANVIAERAVAEIDLRVATMAEAERMTGLILGLEPHTPGAGLQVTGGLNRPPMERTPGTEALFRQARGLAAELGFELEEAATGGGSDGNFCAAVGRPVLDGLGAVGAGAHAGHEQLLVEQMPLRAALVARLVETLG